jgi:hypothetical protein
MDDVRPPQFEIQVPPELENGAYANFLSVWHSPWEFTLDFAVTQQPEALEDGNAAAGIRVPSRVVARVKLPPTLVFDVLQALNENMTRFENTYGVIRRPGQGEEPQHDDR